MTVGLARTPSLTLKRSGNNFQGHPSWPALVVIWGIHKTTEVQAITVQAEAEDLAGSAAARPTALFARLSALPQFGTSSSREQPAIQR